MVGHNPDFAQVVHDLTGARVDFKKGGIAGVRLERLRGELIALLRPRELDRITRREREAGRARTVCGGRPISSGR